MSTATEQPPRLPPWVRMARRFHAVYRERYSKETSVHQFEDWIKEACEKHAAALTQELKRWKAEVAIEQQVNLKAQELINKSRQENQRLRYALKQLYDETADYITVNHLGDLHHNKSMRDARDALEGKDGKAV